MITCKKSISRMLFKRLIRARSIMETVGTVNAREETVIEWSIPDFLSLSEERGVSFFSPLFFFHKASWCIELYPNGVKEDDSDKFMHLSLHRRTSGPPIEIEWCYGIKDASQKSCLYKYTRYVFNKTEHNRSLFWASRSYLLKYKSEYLLSDTLTLVCFIKHPQSTEFSDNLLEANSESVPFISKRNLTSSNLETIGKINVREEFVVEWSIKDFLSLPVRDGVSHLSPLFSFENISWCMEVYAKEEKRGESDEWLLVYLHKKSSGPLMRLEYTFGCVDGIVFNYTGYSTCVFNETESDDGTRELLTRTPKSKVLTFDPLTLICRIKRPQYTEYPSKEDIIKSSKNFHVDKLLQDLKQLFLKQKDCDVVLKVREQEFSAHRNILAARSPVFESTFTNDMKEKETGMVNIEDCDPSSFSDFLCFLYCGETETLSKENVSSLFTTADKYDVQDLKEICMKFMKENISVDTFCDTITLALQHSEAELIRLATDFFTRNSLKIVKTVPWQTFAAENPTQSNELVIKSFEAAASTKE